MSATVQRLEGYRAGRLRGFAEGHDDGILAAGWTLLREARHSLKTLNDPDRAFFVAALALGVLASARSTEERARIVRECIELMLEVTAARPAEPAR